MVELLFLGQWALQICLFATRDYIVLHILKLLSLMCTIFVQRLK